MRRFTTYLLKSSVTGLANSIGSALISFIFIPLIISKVGIEKYGTWAVLAIFIGIPSIAEVGLSKSLVYLIPKQRDRLKIDKIYSSGLLLNYATIVLFGLTGVILYCLKINIWGENALISINDGRNIFICGVIITCCVLATTFYRSVLEAFFKIHLVNLGYLIQTLLHYLVAYIISIYTNDIDFLIVATAAVYFIILVFHLTMVKITTDVAFSMPSIELVRRVLKKSFGFFSVSICFIILQPINRYMVVRFSDDASMYGIFDISIKVAAAASSCLKVFSTPIFGVFSGYGVSQIQKIKKVLIKYFVGLSFGYILGCILFFFIGMELLGFFIETDKALLFHVSMIMLLGFGTSGVAEPFLRTLWALGYVRVAFNVYLIALIANFLVMILLYKASFIYRASIAYSVAYVTVSILTIASCVIKVHLISWGQSIKQ